MKIHACLPWDSHDADTMDRRERDYRADDNRYSQRKICPHPDCDTWIRNDSDSCKPHRGWFHDITHGNDEESKLRKHRQIQALFDSGMTAVEAVAERKRAEATIGEWWAKTNSLDEKEST